MRARNAVDGDHEVNVMPSCDRCGEQSHYIPYGAYPLEDEVYVLCRGCEQAVVTIWLAEHKLLIAQARQQCANREPARHE